MPETWERVLDPAALAVWETVAAAMPREAYLAGGTALAVRLGHRVSRDLDIFVPGPFDTRLLETRLRESGAALVVTRRDEGTLNGILEGARVQFLLASGQRNLDATQDIGGMPVAGLRDLLAMKLKVIGDRGELRDYVDLMVIEQRTPHRFEQGIGYYLQRYGLGPAHSSLDHITRALGAVHDLAPDPALDERLPEVREHFTRRAPEVLAHMRSQGLSPG
jgi:hypothetical protein